MEGSLGFRWVVSKAVSGEVLLEQKYEWQVKQAIQSSGGRALHPHVQRSWGGLGVTEEQEETCEAGVQ